MRQPVRLASLLRALPRPLRVVERGPAMAAVRAPADWTDAQIDAWLDRRPN